MYINPAQITIYNATADDIPVIAQLASVIWPAAYAEILTPPQLKYMLDLIYSNSALEKQMNEGDQFLLLKEDEKPIAFASYNLIKEPGIYKLQKLYALPNQQGKGIGKKLIDYIINKIKSSGATALQLNVNRHNKAKQFYEHLGFKVIYEEDIDIGNGYFMNDYVMELKM
ncbi:MAG: GNAT family N-acetyltransferase [Parafilimonas sp.]